MSYKNLKFEYLFRLMNLINGSTTKDLSFIYNAYKRSSENFDGSMKMLLALGLIKIVEDRIEIEINGSKELNDAVVSYESYFMNEVLGVKLDMGDCITFKYNDSVIIDGEKTIIGISPSI